MGMESTELFGADWDWKIQNENLCLPRDSNPRIATQRQRFRPLGHAGKISSGLFIVLQYPNIWIEMDMWKTQNSLMLSKRYESTEVDRRPWLHVPSGTHCSTSSDTHQVVKI